MKAIKKNEGAVTNGGETSSTTKPEGLTIGQLAEIKNALEQLSKLKSALGYQWARNLNLVTAEINHAQSAYKDSRVSLLEKDEAGNPVNYVADIKDGFVNVCKDKQGKKIVFHKGDKLQEGQTFATQIPDEHLEKWNTIHKSYTEELHVVPWHKIPEEKLSTIAEEEKIEGSLIVPLLGVII